MAIKAVLFDMDGVLIDAKDWHYNALNRALELFGYTISRESHLSTFDGLPTRRKLEMLTAARGLPVGLHGLINTLKQHYTLQITNLHCKPKFQHQLALSRLKSEGYVVTVCSNSVRPSVERMMQLAGLAPYLDMMVANTDVARAKPDPEMYLRVMENFELLPTDCLILEDNDHGIQAARASGAHLMVIGTPEDVTYQAIKRRIAEIDGAEESSRGAGGTSN